MREEASEPRGPQARTLTPPLTSPRPTSPSVAKGVGVVPDLSLQVLAIDGQLIVRTCHRVGGNRTRTFAVATKGLTRFNPVLSYDLFLEAEG